MNPRVTNGRFHLLRYFSLTSLIGILMAALLLTALYRTITISTLTDVGKTVNAALAEMALRSVRSLLVERLLSPGRTAERTESAAGEELDLVIRSMLRESGIAKVQIYDRSGTLVYSTKTARTGDDRADDADVSTALGGRVASEFIYRDHLDPFGRKHPDANLVQSYLPIRREPHGKVIGVFEIYTDISPLTVHTEQAQLLIFAIVAGVFSVLYLLLLAVIRRAEALIHQQERTIRERNQSLEILSAKLLTAQEEEKKQLAHTLHEGVTQILSAVKLKLANAYRSNAVSDVTQRELEFLDGHLKDAIQEVRSLAMRIRPSSLDDMGLVKTLQWLLRELRELYPDLEIESDFPAVEEDIPKPLKTIIFRIVQETLDRLTLEAGTVHIGIVLTTKKNLVELLIEENPIDAAAARGRKEADTFEPMKERTILSGGGYVRDTTPAAANRHVSSWRV